MRIETKRLIIREFTTQMAEGVYRNSQDENVRRFVPDEVFESTEEARSALEELISFYGDRTKPQVYAVILKEGNLCIGYVQLVPATGGKWEAGYHIAAAHTGKGYASEALAAFLPVITERLGVKEVSGISLKENTASLRVLEKCGFRILFEGIGTWQGEEREIVESLWQPRRTKR